MKDAWKDLDCSVLHLSPSALTSLNQLSKLLDRDITLGFIDSKPEDYFQGVKGIGPVVASEIKSKANLYKLQFEKNIQIKDARIGDTPLDQSAIATLEWAESMTANGGIEDANLLAWVKTNRVLVKQLMDGEASVVVPFGGQMHQLHTFTSKPVVNEVPVVNSVATSDVWAVDPEVDPAAVLDLHVEKTVDTEEEKEWLTTSEMAKRMGCSISFVRDRRISGDIKYMKIGRTMVHEYPPPPWLRSLFVKG